MGSGVDILPSNDAEELVDFTCASPWERLALDIELELRAWGLHDGQLPPDHINEGARRIPNESSGGQAIDPPPLTCSKISLGDRVLCLELRVSSQNDSLDSLFPLERLFGMNHCIMLTADTPDGIAAGDGSDASVLLSAMSVAASACSCPVPMVVPVGRPSSLRFIGRQLYPTHLRFSCDYIHQPSDEYSNLAGLLCLFRNKRKSARRLVAPSSGDIRITAKFTYDWSDFSLKLAPSPESFASERRLSASQYAALKEADPISRIRVTAFWDEFPISDLKRNEVLAGMPAATATRLRLSPPADLVNVLTTSSIPSTRISMTAPARVNLRMAQTAANSADRSMPAAPLPVIDVRKSIRNNRHTGFMGQSARAPPFQYEDRSISPRVEHSPGRTALDDYLSQVGEYVAAAAIQDDRIDEEFLTSAVAALFEMDLGRGIMMDVVDALGPNAGGMTVLERVSRLMAASETLNAAQKLWNLFLDGVEVHWEQQWIVSGVPFSAEDGPNHDECLVTQKLQMINCCVERERRARAGKSETFSGVALSGRGRKRLLEGIELVGNGNKDEGRNGETKVWEPHVQPHPLVTRDMVDEELKRMVMRAEHRDMSDDLEAKRQSLTLRSDMMAFKAANPNASMADFVRWFSPSDWVVEDDMHVDEGMESMLKAGVELDTAEKSDNTSNTEICGSKLTNCVERDSKQRGRLSARMSRQGNMWEELWNEAQGIAVEAQEPLFDASAHGSKALADLRAMPMTQVLLHLAIVQVGSAVTLLHHAFSRPPALGSMKLAIERGRHAVRDVCANIGLDGGDAADIGRVAVAVDAVAAAEHSGLVATSVLTKLPPADGMGRIVDKLACAEAAEVTGEGERQLVIRMAGLDDGGWKKVCILLPEWREFVLKGEGGDRMYTSLSSDEFRVAFRLGLEYSV